MAYRATYHPMKFPHGLWGVESRLGAKDVWLETSDRVRLHGWQFDAPQAKVVTLFFHGNAGNISHRFHHIQKLTSASSSVLIIDYRGYGKSEGTPSEKGLFADAEAAYQFLVKAGEPPDRIVVHGESLGCAVAIDLAARHPCAGVVLEAPFPSSRAVASRLLPLIGSLVVWTYDSTKKLGTVHAPVLVLHGESDDIIPIALGKEVFSLAREPKSFWAVPGGGHNDLIEAAGFEYERRLRDFYASLPSTGRISPPSR